MQEWHLYKTVTCLISVLLSIPIYGIYRKETKCLPKNLKNLIKKYQNRKNFRPRLVEIQQDWITFRSKTTIFTYFLAISWQFLITFNFLTISISWFLHTYFLAISGQFLNNFNFLANSISWQIQFLSNFNFLAIS